VPRLFADGEDGAHPGLLGRQGHIELDGVHATVDTVDDQVSRVTHAIAGDTLASEMAGDGRA